LGQSGGRYYIKISGLVSSVRITLPSYLSITKTLTGLLDVSTQRAYAPNWVGYSVPASDLVLAKTAAPTVVANGTVTWQLTVSNTAGSADSHGFIIKDVVPSNVTNPQLVNPPPGCTLTAPNLVCGIAPTGYTIARTGSPVDTNTQAATLTASGGTDKSNVPVVLAAGSSLTVNFTGTAPTPAPATITNKAYVYGADLDPNTTNNNSTANTTVTVPPPDGVLVMAKDVQNTTASGSPSTGSVAAAPGDLVDYHLSFANTPTAPGPVKDSVVYDILPYASDPMTLAPGTPRGSSDSLIFLGLSPPTGWDVEYSQSTNPCRPEVDATGPPGCVNDWDANPPAPASLVRSLKFVQQSAHVINPGGPADVATIHMQVPDSSTWLLGNAAWNSVAAHQGGGTHAPIEVGPVGVVYQPAQLSWSKVGQSNQVLSGATFYVTGPSGFAPVTVTDNGPDDQDPAGGQFLLTGLPVGAYTITETIAPTGYTVTTQTLTPKIQHAGALTQAGSLMNFLIPPTVTKSVVDADAVRTGDEVTWTINAGIPAGTLDGYQITDQIDPRLTFDPNTDVSVRLSTDTPPASSLTLSPDGVQAGDYTLDHTNGLLTITFTETFPGDGLDALEAAYTNNPATTVVVQIVTTVDDVGVIENAALLYPHAYSFTKLPTDPGGPVQSATVATKWGSIVVQKQDLADAALGQDAAGATFQVYGVDPTLNANAKPIEIGGDGNPATVDSGVSSWEVDPGTGEVTIEGLRYSDFEDGADIADPNDWQHYWLVETKAPNGYELSAEPIQFDLTADNDSILVSTSNPVAVPDAPHNAGYELPFAGGPGPGPLTATGAGIIALAMLTALLSTPRRGITARHGRYRRSCLDRLDNRVEATPGFRPRALRALLNHRKGRNPGTVETPERSKPTRKVSWIGLGGR
jgi:fimbrial isopeptide formation D2 family protein